MKRYLPLAIIVGALALVIVASLLVFRSKQAGTSAPFTTETSATPAVASSANVRPETKLDKSCANVSVAVEEHGDYQCPPCGLLHPEIKKIQREYGDRINFVFRNLPLTKIHKNALNAAQAAEAARLQGWFWQMHDLIYENQNVWKDEKNPRPTFTKYAQDLGLDPKHFIRDMG